jgi:hypothetical protein
LLGANKDVGLSPPRQFAVRRVSKDAATLPTSTNRCRPEALRTAADDPEAAVGRIIELAKIRIPSGSVSIRSATSRCMSDEPGRRLCAVVHACP